MSTDPEASPFEEALRADLPSAETEARLRRRLLAAGLAVGNGIATSTAAAAAGTGAGAASGGIVANVVGLSWGIKLGFAAAVAIPTLGLLIDGTEPAPRTARPQSVASAASVVQASVEARPPRPQPPELTANEAAVELPSRIETRPVASMTPRREPPNDVEAAPGVVQAHEPAPSQRAFAATLEPPAVAQPSRTTLAEETRLLDAAFAELAAGNRARAAQLIAEHESRYPRGLLSKERERARTRLSELSRGN